MGGAWEEGMYQEVDHSCFGLYLLAWWWTLAAKCTCDDTSQTSESKQLFLETFFFPSGLKLLNLLKKSLCKNTFSQEIGTFCLSWLWAFQHPNPISLLMFLLSVFPLSKGWRAFHCCKGRRIVISYSAEERDKQSFDLIFKADGSLLSACHGPA